MARGEHKLPADTSNEPSGKKGDLRPRGGGEPGFGPGDMDLEDRFKDHAHVQSSTSTPGKNLFTGRTTYPRSQRSDEGDYPEE